jgi:hypothetical protein
MSRHVVDQGARFAAEGLMHRWEVCAHDGNAPLATFAAREDAHAFARAPDLVEASQRALDFLDANYSNADMPDILPPLRAALRRAL